MKRKIVALSLILLIATLCVTSLFSVQAVGPGDWITGYKIEENKTKQLLVEVDSAKGVNRTYAPILPGAELKITFNVNVLVSGSGNLKLTTSMSSLTQQRWDLVTDEYQLGSAFNPNSASTEFNWVKGEFTMIAYGIAPTPAANKPAEISAVRISGASGDLLDQISIQVVSAQMDQFQSLLTQKQEKLQTWKASGVAAGWIEMYQNVLTQAEAVAAGGQVANAIALLNGLDVSNPPVSSTMEMLFLPITVVLAAIAVIFVVLFLRVRGKISYFQLVVEDQIKDLEGLTLRASKIDRTMSSNLESVKDRLKRLVGM